MNFYFYAGWKFASRIMEWLRNFTNQLDQTPG